MNASVSYEKQKMRKLCVDEVKHWCTTFNLEDSDGDVGSLFNKSKCSKSSGTSKRSLILIRGRILFKHS